MVHVIYNVVYGVIVVGLIIKIALLSNEVKDSMEEQERLHTRWINERKKGQKTMRAYSDLSYSVAKQEEKKKTKRGPGRPKKK